jgi:hypothetical protein
MSGSASTCIDLPLTFNLIIRVSSF